MSGGGETEYTLGGGETEYTLGGDEIKFGEIHLCEDMQVRF